MFGDIQAADFTCGMLEAVREAMTRPYADPKSGRPRRGWCRTHANRQVSRIKHALGWGVTKGLVPAVVHETLLRLPGLRAGKSAARESAPVRPAGDAQALAVVPHVSRQVGTMIRVQLLTGMRSTELCLMRGRDIDRRKAPWIYRPIYHKTEHHEISREIPIGPVARDLLAPFLDGRDPDAFLFSPAEAEAERRQRQRTNRKTPVQPSQVLRSQKAARRTRRRAPKDRYDRTSYHRAVRYGCEAAFGMPKELKRLPTDTADQLRAKTPAREKWHREHGWHPHMIRHRTATDLRRAGGLDVAQVVLGHSTQKMTEQYAEADVARAHEVIERIG